MIARFRLRLPRYGLRTLFVMVTVFACWLGWEVKYVHQRQAALSEIGKHPGSYAFLLSDFDVVSLRNWWPEPGSEPRIPVWRTWIGDETAVGIGLADGTEEDIKRVRELFPEVPPGDVSSFRRWPDDKANYEWP